MAFPFDAHAFPASENVEFAAVTKVNYTSALELCVTPEQQRHVGTVAEALVLAHFDPAVRAVLVYHRGAAAAFLMYHRIAATDVRLMRLLVDCTVQRKRIGARVMDALVEAARTLGATRITLRVARTADDAIAFYRRCGFEINTAVPTTHTHFDAVRTL